MTFAFNNIKEEAKCMGDFILNPSHHIRYIIKKYVTTNDTYKYVEFKEGTHYIFRTPDNLLYIIDESDLSQIKIALTKQIMDVTKLKENISWFFDEFLAFEEYTKVRDGKIVANSIIHSLQKIINKSSIAFDLIEEYKTQKT